MSVVIPAFNRAHLVCDAVDSVLAQSFRDYEIILVDDGSTDGTEDLLRSRYSGKLRYEKQENQGISAARNRGIQLARGKYVAFLDSDDKWFPEKLARQVECMEMFTDIGMLCTRFRAYEIGNEDRLRFGPDDFSAKFQDLLMSQNFIPTSTVMVRRECFDAVGVFDPEIPCYEDFDLWLRIARRYRYDCLPELLVEYREHPQNTGKILPKTHEGLWKVYARILERYPDEITDMPLFKNRVGAFQYLTGTALLKKGERREGYRLISGAFCVTPFFGAYFAKGKGPLLSALSILKTVLVLVWAWGTFRKFNSCIGTEKHPET